MRRMTVVLGLLLMLGTLVQPAVLGSPAPAGNAPPSLFGPRAVYHTYASMVSELQGLQSAHPDLVKMESIGKTYEGRDIWAVKVSDDVGTNDTAEPDVLVFGAIHAREVMGVEVPMFVLNYLLDNYGKNETTTKYVNTREIWFVPMLNVDGHVYIETPGNDWRKNRRPTTGGNIGVDLNRNFGYMFGVDGSTSADPASEVYHGPYPFSENETIAIRDLALRQRFATSLSYHSVASLVLYPWGYTTDPAPDHDELDLMARTMAAWNGYTPEQSCALYFTHGTSDDWLYGNMSTLAFTIELDTAFHPPESQIPISCALNREPTLYIIGYPNATIMDAGVFALTSPANGTVVEPDRPLNVSAKVMNYGSDQEDVPVEMEITAGPYVYRNSTNLTLRAGQVGQFNVSWSPPLPGAENYTIDVHTGLAGDAYAWNDRKGAQFRIRAKYGVQMSSAVNTTLSCYPGENVTYPLKVTSLSNREDDIQFVMTGNPTEWARIPSSAHLAPMANATVELAVSVPRNALPGMIVSISVRAQSSTGLGQGGLVSTNTVVLDPAPVAVAGKDITVNVTQEARFDGSASRTPMGNLTGYHWDFGDGNGSEGATAVHAYARRGLYVANLTVTNDRGWTGKASLNVSVTQAFKVELLLDPSSVKVPPGNSTTVNVTLRNAGNGPDTFLLSLEAPKWAASLDVQKASLLAGEMRAIELTVTSPAGSLAGAAAMFRVKAVSEQSVYAKADVVLTAAVDAVHALDFTIPDDHKTADAGTAPFFQALVQNRGNIAENLTISADDVPDGWSVRFSRESVSLTPGNGTNVRITVEIPAGALAGEYGFTVNGLELGVAVRERHALEAAADVQAVSARQGQYLFFNLTIRNAGNIQGQFTARIPALPAGWQLAGTPAPVTLQPGANSTVNIGFRVPSNAKPATYDMALEAGWAGDANVTRSVAVSVKVLQKDTGGTTAAFPSTLLILLLILLVVVVVAAAVGTVAYSRRKKGKAGPAAAAADGPVDQPAAGPPPAAPYERQAAPAPDAYPGQAPVAYEAAPARGAYATAPEAVAYAAAPEVVAMSYGSEGDVLVAEAVPYDEGAPPAVAQQVPGQVSCLWCFKQVREGEIWRQCPGCGALLHAECAAAARSCPRCGGLV